LKKERTKKKKGIKEKYNATSFFYDKRYGNIQFQKYNEIIHSEDLEKTLIFDAGCGTGLLSEYFQKMLDSPDQIDFKYVGVDISIQMIQIFKKKLEKIHKKLSNKYNLILADLENLPIRKNSFNFLISITSYQNLPDMKKGFGESLGVLKNNSSIIISILKKKLENEKFLSFLEDKMEILKIIDDQRIEDIIIKGIKISNSPLKNT
jgi:ubiquinone/menaquinone biosynthesis C-methylase UbiE